MRKDSSPFCNYFLNPSPLASMPFSMDLDEDDDPDLLAREKYNGMSGVGKELEYLGGTTLRQIQAKSWEHSNGYIAPKYAMEGIFSTKSDVYSFGVLLLEIVRGEKNYSMHHYEHLNLIGFAWELWKEGRGLELVDRTLGSWCSNDALRCIHVRFYVFNKIMQKDPSAAFYFERSPPHLGFSKNKLEIAL